MKETVFLVWLTAYGPNDCPLCGVFSTQLRADLYADEMRRSDPGIGLSIGSVYLDDSLVRSCGMKSA